MTISDTALHAMRGNNYLMADLMRLFNRCQNTIENWMKAKDIRLTTPAAVKIIVDNTGLKEEQVLEEVHRKGVR